MKAEVIECDRCQTTTRVDSREAVSYTRVSVLKSGVCKEYDLCPNDADEFKKWLGPDATPAIPDPEESQPTEVLAANAVVDSAWRSQHFENGS